MKRDWGSKLCPQRSFSLRGDPGAPPPADFPGPSPMPMFRGARYKPWNVLKCPLLIFFKIQLKGPIKRIHAGINRQRHTCLCVGEFVYIRVTIADFVFQCRFRPFRKLTSNIKNSEFLYTSHLNSPISPLTLCGGSMETCMSQAWGTFIPNGWRFCLLNESKNILLHPHHRIITARKLITLLFRATTQAAFRLCQLSTLNTTNTMRVILFGECEGVSRLTGEVLLHIKRFHISLQVRKTKQLLF